MGTQSSFCICYGSCVVAYMIVPPLFFLILQKKKFRGATIDRHTHIGLLYHSHIFICVCLFWSPSFFFALFCIVLYIFVCVFVMMLCKVNTNKTVLLHKTDKNLVFPKITPFLHNFAACGEPSLFFLKKD